MNGFTLTAALISASAAALAIAQTASPPPPTGMMGHGMMMGSMARHHQAMMSGIPEPYRSMHNPPPYSAATLRRGAQVYAENCAACHGPRGYGDGSAGQ